MGRVAQGHASGQKFLNLQRGVGRGTCKSPLMKWANLLKETSVKQNTASHNKASLYTGTDGFLEHPASRGNLYYKDVTLQKIIPGFL